MALVPFTEPIDVLKELLKIEFDLYDEYANDGDGRFDMWQSDELQRVVSAAKQFVDSDTRKPVSKEEVLTLLSACISSKPGERVAPMSALLKAIGIDATNFELLELSNKLQ